MRLVTYPKGDEMEIDGTMRKIIAAALVASDVYELQDGAERLARNEALPQDLRDMAQRAYETLFALRCEIDDLLGR